MTRFQFLIVLLATFAATARGADARTDRGWGDWQGRIVCDCEQPIAPEVITIDKDQVICGKSMQGERLLIHPKDGGLANVCVFLSIRSDDPSFHIHPDYEKTAADKVVMEISKGRFVPHCVAMRTTQTLLVKNLDPIGHNQSLHPFINTLPGTILGGAETEYKIPQQEVLPFPVTCGIHPWMGAWVLVRDNPYMAVTDESGRFLIRDLPVGEWTFQLWHEKAGWLREGKLAGETLAWPKGRIIAKIAEGKNELGELHVNSKMFEDAKK